MFITFRWRWTFAAVALITGIFFWSHPPAQAHEFDVDPNNRDDYIPKSLNSRTWQNLNLLVTPNEYLVGQGLNSSASLGSTVHNFWRECNQSLTLGNASALQIFTQATGGNSAIFVVKLKAGPNAEFKPIGTLTLRAPDGVRTRWSCEYKASPELPPSVLGILGTGITSGFMWLRRRRRPGFGEQRDPATGLA